MAAGEGTVLSADLKSVYLSTDAVAGDVTIAESQDRTSFAAKTTAVTLTISEDRVDLGGVDTRLTSPALMRQAAITIQK